ncbi:MAG: hypothetical protein HC815_32110, partial [Richelia sp. RM1_1_1]|nr:hypothetical protein [Richelia sp. RM1_1_1]
MNSDYLGLKFSNLDSDNQLTIEEDKLFSLQDLLASHNHGDDDEHEHGHDYAGSTSTLSQNKTFVSASFINPPSSTINVNYHGFSQQAKNAFEYVVDIWEGWIKSDIPMQVNAYWEDLSPYGSNILGAASPYSFTRNFTGATKENTYYPIALANHLAGKDLNGDKPEIEIYLNSNFSKWYLGTDGNTPTTQYDFTTVVLHEFVHGFGLTDFISYNNGIGSYGNTIFETFVVNGNNQTLSSFPNNSQELGKQLTSNNLFFNGANATEANGGLYPKLYAPSSWQYGSSVAHLDEKTYPKGHVDALMTPLFVSGEAIHNPGGITLGILEDLGWDINQVYKAPADETQSTPTQQPVENKSTSEMPTLSFNSLNSYADQDKTGILNISADGKEFEMQGNSWKKLSIDYNITVDTILEFEYNSTVLGEIQGIGFDIDNKLTSTDAKNIFQLAGTQKGWGIPGFEYQTNSGWKSYQIRVGDYMSGQFNYLVFANDHDVSNPDAHSQFRNLRLYEYGQIPIAETQPIPEAKTQSTPTQQPAETQPIREIPTLNFNSLDSYADQDKTGILNISADGKEFEVQGNSWKKLSIDYNITVDTILEFEYNSTVQGEIQGIGFDVDNKLTSTDAKNIFQLAGTQKGWGIPGFEYQTNSGWQSYQIRVGDYMSGQFNYLVFANDHDVRNADAHSQFRNLRLYEYGQIPTAETQPIREIPTLSFDSLDSYADQDKTGILNISDDGKEFEVQGNSWKKLSIDYNITVDTILEFEYNSTVQGEIQGIGFDVDNKLTSTDAKNIFQLAGTQKGWGIPGFEYQTNSGWQSYQIRVGDYMSGQFNYLVFANDHDV